MPLGCFPFKYLGVPLTTRKLFYNECKPLIEKTMARVRTWSVKKLSYVARIQLINAILHGFQLYWCQIFMLPKKVYKEIQGICRIFLWTGQDSYSRKAPIAWESLCLPKSCGGLNIKNLVIWNKAAVAKHFWAVCQKQDRLWIKWLHEFYIKQQNILLMATPNWLSWSMKKVLESREIFFFMTCRLHTCFMLMCFQSRNFIC